MDPAIHVHQIHKAFSNTSILESRDKPVYVTHHAGKSLSLGFYRAYRAHLAVSEFSARLYRDKIPKTKVIYGGAEIAPTKSDVPDIARTIDKHGGPVLLFAGVFRRNKNIPELIDSTAKLCKMGLDPLLVLCGEAWTAHEMANLVSSVPPEIRGNVLFTYFLDEGRKNRLYSLCDVFVSASSHEYLGLAFIEAMMEAKPVVARRVGGVPEVVTDGVTGFLYGATQEADESGDLTEKLALLLEDRRLARRMGINGMERARAFFTWSRVAERTLAMYREGPANRR